MKFRAYGELLQYWAQIVLCDVTIIYARLCPVPRTRTKALKLNVFLYSLKHICNSTSIYNCVLCFKEIDKDYERFLVKSKKKTMFGVSVALGNLDFYIHAVSEYICIVKWGWKAYTTPVRMFAASISILLTDSASCLFSSGRWFRELLT